MDPDAVVFESRCLRAEALEWRLLSQQAVERLRDARAATRRLMAELPAGQRPDLVPPHRFPSAVDAGAA